MIKIQPRVSSRFAKLASEIYSNAAESMQIPADMYMVNVSKTNLDGLTQILHSERKSKMQDEIPEFASFMTLYSPNHPETFLTEDETMEMFEYGNWMLENFEGGAAHELGHIKDVLLNTDNYKVVPLGTAAKCCRIAKREYEADKNALDAGFGSGLFANRINAMKGMCARSLTHNVITNDFGNLLGSIGYQAAFMQSEKPSKIQKKALQDTWDKLASKVGPPIDSMLKCRELKESPELFGDERFIENFVNSNIDKFRQYVRRTSV